MARESFCPTFSLSRALQNSGYQTKTMAMEGPVLGFRAGPCLCSALAHITIKNGVLLMDPDNTSTSHSCDLLSRKWVRLEVLVPCYVWKTGIDTRETRKRPHQTFHGPVGGVPEIFGEYDDRVQEAISPNLTLGLDFTPSVACLCTTTTWTCSKLHTQQHAKQVLSESWKGGFPVAREHYFRRKWWSFLRTKTWKILV